MHVQVMLVVVVIGHLSPRILGEMRNQPVVEGAEVFEAQIHGLVYEGYGQVLVVGRIPFARFRRHIHWDKQKRLD